MSFAKRPGLDFWNNIIVLNFWFMIRELNKILITNQVGIYKTYLRYTWSVQLPDRHSDSVVHIADCVQTDTKAYVTLAVSGKGIGDHTKMALAPHVTRWRHFISGRHWVFVVDTWQASSTLDVGESMTSSWRCAAVISRTVIAVVDDDVGVHVVQVECGKLALILCHATDPFVQHLKKFPTTLK